MCLSRQMSKVEFGYPIGVDDAQVAPKLPDYTQCKYLSAIVRGDRGRPMGLVICRLNSPRGASMSKLLSRLLRPLPPYTSANRQGAAWRGNLSGSTPKVEAVRSRCGRMMDEVGPTEFWAIAYLSASQFTRMSPIPARLRRSSADPSSPCLQDKVTFARKLIGVQIEALYC